VREVILEMLSCKKKTRAKYSSNSLDSFLNSAMNIEFVYLIIQGINCFMNLAIDQSRASSTASFIVTKGPKKDAIITLK